MKFLVLTRRSIFGETCHLLQICLKEHAANIVHDRIAKSSLVEHSCNTTHQIRMDNASLIATNEHYNKRRMREPLEIKRGITH